MNRAQVDRRVHAVGQSLPLMNGALSESSVRMETMIVGEASNPGLSLMSTSVDSSMGIENALEFDLTQRDSESEVAVDTCSDTESCVDVPNNRRLRLVWDPSVPDPLPQ